MTPSPCSPILLDKGFEFIMLYQDHLKKLIHLPFHRSKCAEELVYQLYNIFTKFGTSLFA